MSDADDQITALSREVERLSRQVVTNQAQVRELAKHILADRAPGAGDDDEAEVLPSWLATTDWEQACDLAELLLPWLNTVYLRYSDAILSPCWAWHPEVVEELWWLRNAWQDAFTGANASWQKVGDWHDRQRPGVVSRVRATIGTCGLDLHTDPATDVAPAAPLEAAIPHVVTAWASPERSAWPPAPTADQLAEAERVHSCLSPRRRRPGQ